MVVIVWVSSNVCGKKYCVRAEENMDKEKPHFAAVDGIMESGEGEIDDHEECRDVFRNGGSSIQFSTNKQYNNRGVKVFLCGCGVGHGQLLEQLF